MWVSASLDGADLLNRAPPTTLTLHPALDLHGVRVVATACFSVPGAERCSEPVVVNSSFLVCNAPRMRVGAYPVTVSLNGVNSTSSTILHRLCDQGWFGLPGEECGACPEVRACSAQFPRTRVPSRGARRSALPQHPPTSTPPACCCA
jgi:hypothetical protein